MASVIDDPDGRRRILFVDPNGVRRAVRLGKIDRKNADSICRHVETLLAAMINRHSMPRETAVWLADIGAKLHERLARAGLVEGRKRPEQVTLAEFMQGYFDRRPDVKEATKTNWNRTVRVLNEFFGPSKPLLSVTPADARDFERWLHTDAARITGSEEGQSTLAQNTIRRRIGIAKQFFNDAVERGLIGRNPFNGLKAAVTGNAAKRRFITREEIDRLLAVCPDSQWRLLVVLARYAGLRVPSESHALTWDCIDWKRNRIRVACPKTARHPGRESRDVPMFPELVQPLLDAFEATPKGETKCIWGIGSTNPGTHLKRLIRKAGLKPWPKVFVNLRASRATELAGEFPSHVAAAWLGHTEAIADKHYRSVTESDFEKAAQKTAQLGAENSRNDSQQQFGHLPELLSLRYVADSDDYLSNENMGATGLEPVTPSVSS